MLEQEVALGALAAVYTLIVAQHILDPVQARGAVSAVLAAVAAYNLHAQAAGYYLALVAILEAHVLGGGPRVVLQLAALVPALAVDLDDGAAGARVRGGMRGEGVAEGNVTQRV